MSPSLRNLRVSRDRRLTTRCRWQAKPRAAFTLVELIFSMTILSFSAAIFGGLVLAISGAWEHSTALEDSRRQAQAALGRIKWMVQQCGTYRVSGGATTVGLAVIGTNWGGYQAPTTLVVWSGGSQGGMNAQGLQSRLPIASELAVYVPDSTNPALLVEVTFPGNSTAIDFNANNLASSIESLLSSASRQSVLLANRVHVTRSTQRSLPELGNVRFELSHSPTDNEIAAVSVGSQDWNNLAWAQGLVGADYGLRTAHVRIELLLDPDPNRVATDGNFSTALPFPASVIRQYVYEP
jgi:type II secretory pathway pseudopilin PulG